MGFAQFCIVFAFLGVCSAFFKLERDEEGVIKWNDLRVTWGRQVTGKNFDPLPRTVEDAREKGFVRSSNCDANPLWRGVRYIQEENPYVILLFDINGLIAGIQITTPKNVNSTLPSSTVMPAFQEDGDMYVMSAYFIDPGRICTTGRSETEFLKTGTGSHLYLQYGSDPVSDYIVGPRNQNDTSGTLWLKGGYIPTMGLHFWYNLSLDMDCDKLLPYFIMYNEGQLTGFGFAVPLKHPSTRFEQQPPRKVQGISMGILPTCLDSLKGISSLHVFLTDIDAETGAGYSFKLKTGCPLQVVSFLATLLMIFAASF